VATSKILIDINGLPLLACLLVSGILVYLGMHVVERKVIFVDLALAQIAALGVMWAILMGYDHETETLPVSLYSLAFTVVGAFVFSIHATRSERVPHEALIWHHLRHRERGRARPRGSLALGTEALKELIAGARRARDAGDRDQARDHVPRDSPACSWRCTNGFTRISRDPQGAEAAGMSIRMLDFFFYRCSVSVITQSVSVLGVLPVFAYLVITAVAAAFLFESIRARLIFGWAFAGVVISLVGLETARISQLDPGPTIVCLFRRSARPARRLFCSCARTGSRRKPCCASAARSCCSPPTFPPAGTLLFRKPSRTDELATAIEFAQSGDPTQMRQAMESFRKFPRRRRSGARSSCRCSRNRTLSRATLPVALLADTHATEAIGPLVARLGDHVEPDAAIRENLVRALRAIGDPSVVGPLVAPPIARSSRTSPSRWRSPRSSSPGRIRTPICAKPPTCSCASSMIRAHRARPVATLPRRCTSTSCSTRRSATTPVSRRGGSCTAPRSAGTRTSATSRWAPAADPALFRAGAVRAGC